MAPPAPVAVTGGEDLISVSEFLSPIVMPDDAGAIRWSDAFISCGEPKPVLKELVYAVKQGH